ncbi:asialoglycoprotein receptor 1-like [Micropterus dolomieu]|uniref:asialoglycoprotein receptor 1-like n=1 Tax=Micropterus dolomieu TaxID=147949 RepID=UPI001E8DE4F0|nr:asialoglycoprotein receptor 1-like [Micropterus dolomieu]XP_045903622.1 asialoglycoprotein receptor 1-like [Micropterus dolomieu]XP_045903623.1 asialoglycoprotein receptor 1-like [Micropterus dolomieu]
MAEDLYTKPDLIRKVRFQTGEKEDRNTELYDNSSNVRINHNNWAEGSTPLESQDNTTGNQQKTTSVNVSSGQRNLFRAVAVFLLLLCLLLQIAVIVLMVQLIQDKSNWNMERNQLWMDNANLTSERHKLQRRYSEMESLNHFLTQNISQLENEKKLLQAINTNLTKERAELQTKLETPCCPNNWEKFGNSCYLISTETKNWNDSRKICKNVNAELVIISSIEEQRFMSSFGLETWIGLTDEETEGDWKWVNGTRVTETYWRTGQPDNKGEKTSENCAEISIQQDLKNWNDLSCTKSLFFICETTLFFKKNIK